MQSQIIDDQYRLIVKDFWQKNSDLGEMCFIDLETTGLSPLIHEILEIGIIRIDAHGTITTFQELVSPKGFISEENEKIHGISLAMVKNEAKIEDVLPRCLDFIKNATLVGHNVQFDCGFLIIQALKQKIILEGNSVFDTCLFSRQVAKKTKKHPLNHKLTTLINIYVKNSPILISHRALWDSLASLKVFIELANVIAEKKEFDRLFKIKSFVYKLPDSKSVFNPETNLQGMCEKDKDVLTLAIRETKNLLISYLGGTHGEGLRPIRPVALLPTQKDLVLHAECLLTHQMRNFKLKQIKSLQLKETIRA